MSTVLLQHKLRLGGSTCFRGFISIGWEHVNFEEEIIPNPSEEISTYLNQVRHAIKGRLLPNARRAFANAYLKTVIQVL